MALFIGGKMRRGFDKEDHKVHLTGRRSGRLCYQTHKILFNSCAYINLSTYLCPVLLKINA